MKLSPTLKRYLWKSTLWVGPGLVTTGLVIGGVQRSPSALAIAFVLVGIILTIVGVGWWGGLVQSLLQKRSTQAGTDAVIATVSLLVILGLLNVLAVQYPLRWDATETRLFTLAPQTKRLVSGLVQPMKVWIFETNPNSIDRELLNSYRRLSDRFTYTYVDPQVDIGLADRFDVQVVGEVYLEYQDKQQLIQTLREGETLAEVQLTNGIEKILRDRQPQIYFLQGHGEMPLEPIEGGLYQAVSGLEEKGYGIWPLDLTEADGIPDDATVVIVAGPQQALLPGEVDEIADYLEVGGSLLVMLDPETFSGLDSLLEDWGLAMDGRLVIDASGTGVSAELGPATPVVTDYGTHPITLDFQDRISFYPLAQAVIVEDEVEDVEVTPLVLTTEASWSERNLASETLEFDPDEDLEGPLNLAVAATRSLDPDILESLEDRRDRREALERDADDFDPEDREETLESEEDEAEIDDESRESSNESISDSADNEDEEIQPETRLILFGNATFASNGWFEQQLNGDVFLNSVKWLANENEDLLYIRPKTLADRRINLHPVQAALLAWLAIAIFPLMAFGMAGWLWWRDR